MKPLEPSASIMDRDVQAKMQHNKLPLLRQKLSKF